MRESARPAPTALALTALVALCGCRGRETSGGSVPLVATAGQVADACAGDSLRPATAAPAPGLWMYEQPSGERVAAMIGPARPDDRTLAVTRVVESLEVSASGDTIRHRAGAATVSLELLPPLGPVTSGDGAPAGSAEGVQPAATYAVSRHVRLAAYEPCATSQRGARIRYLRRDAAGRIVTDVLLHRASDQ
jgi:hypothetical protein